MAPQKVLLLGSGFVARPTLDILSDAGIEASVEHSRVPRSAEGVKLARPISLDVTYESALDAEVEKHDLVISLIPYTFHAAVIKSAIKKKKHVVTTSYVSPAMMELDQHCKNAGITVMNEIASIQELIIYTLSRRSRRYRKLTIFPDMYMKKLPTIQNIK